MSRIETDSLGQVEVPEDAYWGAQTQRSLINFAIGNERMPLSVLHALALIKKAAARVNDRFRLGISCHRSPTASIRSAMFTSVKLWGCTSPLSTSSHVHGAETGAPGLARTA